MKNTSPRVLDAIVFSLIKSIFYTCLVGGVAATCVTGDLTNLAMAAMFLVCGTFLGPFFALPCILISWICVRIFLSRNVMQPSIWIISSLLISGAYSSLFPSYSVVSVCLFVGGLTGFFTWDALVRRSRDVLKVPAELLPLS